MADSLDDSYHAVWEVVHRRAAMPSRTPAEVAAFRAKLEQQFSRDGREAKYKESVIAAFLSNFQDTGPKENRRYLHVLRHRGAICLASSKKSTSKLSDFATLEFTNSGGVTTRFVRNNASPSLVSLLNADSFFHVNLSRESLFALKVAPLDWVLSKDFERTEQGHSRKESPGYRDLVEGLNGSDLELRIGNKDIVQNRWIMLTTRTNEKPKPGWPALASIRTVQYGHNQEETASWSRRLVAVEPLTDKEKALVTSMGIKGIEVFDDRLGKNAVRRYRYPGSIPSLESLKSMKAEPAHLTGRPAWVLPVGAGLVLGGVLLWAFSRRLGARA